MPAANRLTDIYCLVMLLAFPLYTGLEGYASITRSKFFFFAAATLLWLAAMAFCALTRRIHRPDIGPMGPAAGSVAAYMAACCLSALCSPYGVRTLLGAGRWDGLVTLLLYGAAFLGVRAFGRLRPAHLYALGLAVLLCTAVAVPQLLGYDPLRLFPGQLNYFDAHIRYTGEFLGTIGNVDLLSGFLCLGIPLLTAAWILDARRAPLLLPAGAGVFLLLASRVSGGPVGLAAGALLAAPVLLRSRARLMRALLAGAALGLCAFWALALDFTPEGVRLAPGPAALALLALCPMLLAGAAVLRALRRPEPSAGRYTKTVAAAAGLVLLLGLAAVYFWPGESGAVHELSRLLHGELRDSFGSSRIRIWRETLALFPERPLLGGGPGTLSLRLELGFSRSVPETGQTLHTFVDNAHNEYLAILTDAGALGLLAYLAALALSLRDWFRRRREPSLAPAAGCALIAYWVQGLFGLGLCLTAPVYWVLWGLAGTTGTGCPDAPAGSSVPAGSE